jgi:hypothetical protein
MNPHGRYRRLATLIATGEPLEPVTPVVTPIITTCPSCNDIELHYTEFPATAAAFPAEHIRECEACRQYTTDENASLARLYAANISLAAFLSERE